ncbi:hypothetical protein P171DRAFT_445368 [Karstenula rhodostoma CBS 690.94]|uniref:RING-type domain-containing protein n=1 Tax=Karstenula rhodostoma CBS 690.94 TaxID=1392251 RepID=A0A9P4PEZ2_9PLEO|nr:hypothetical protein P171DRAFT_445368 [Karstenula rhodostoma CBS 690.94]
MDPGRNLEEKIDHCLGDDTRQEDWWRELKALYHESDVRWKEALRQVHKDRAAPTAREDKDARWKPLSQAKFAEIVEHRRKVEVALKALGARGALALRQFLSRISIETDLHRTCSGRVKKQTRLHRKKTFLKPDKPKPPVSPLASLPFQSILCTQVGNPELHGTTTQLSSTVVSSKCIYGPGGELVFESYRVKHNWHLGVDCNCRKVHIDGSVWASLTKELEFLIRICKASKGVLSIPGSSVYRGHAEFVSDKQSSCSRTDCLACLQLAGIRRFVAHTLRQAESLQSEAILLLASDFFPLIGGKLSAEQVKHFDPHAMLMNALKMHPYRLSAYQAMLMMLGKLGNDEIAHPRKALEYSEKLRVLCESWFSYTRRIFAPENLTVDHSDKIFMFDRVFAPNNQMSPNDENTKDVECMICGDKAEGKTKLVRVPCGHTFCVDCLKKWRVNSPQDQNFSYQYRCPLCRKCLACGAQGCEFHKVQMPKLRDHKFKIGSIWPIPLESLLKSVFTMADPSLLGKWDQLEPVRLMQASTYIKLRENTREARALLRYNMKLCRKWAEWYDSRSYIRGPEYRAHFNAAEQLFKDIAAEFRRATQNEPISHDAPDWDALDWCARPELYPAVATLIPRDNPELCIGPIPFEQREPFLTDEGADPETIV